MGLDKEIEDLHRMMEAEEEAKRQALLDKLKLIQDRIAAKDKAIEELKYERGLIFNNLCNVINNELRYSTFNIFMGFDSDMFWKAWRWSAHKDTVEEELAKGELTKDEYKKHKFCFDITVKTIKEKFFGDLKDKVKFKNIIMDWTIGYDYTYIYKNQEIIIFIPLFHAADKDWEYALAGYRVNYKSSECCHDWVCGGLDYKKVAKELQEWMLAEGWKKDGK